MTALKRWLREPFVAAEMSTAEWCMSMAGIIGLSVLAGWTLRGWL